MTETAQPPKENPIPVRTAAPRPITCAFVIVAGFVIAMMFSVSVASAGGQRSLRHRRLHTASCVRQVHWRRRRLHHRRRHFRARIAGCRATVANANKPGGKGSHSGSSGGSTGSGSTGSTGSGSTGSTGSGSTGSGSTGSTGSGSTGSTGSTGTGGTGSTTPASGLFGIAAGGALQNEDPTTLGRDLDADQAAGAKWLRVDINWSQIQNGGPDSYQWAPIDALVADAEARGMRVLGTIVYTPSWARPAGTSAAYGPSPSTYASFAAAAVSHYAALGVNAYEIWNEPNTPNFWKPAPSTSAYTAVLKAAYTAIKGVDPSATVVTGGTAPAPSNGVSYSPVDFLSGIYANGGQGYFDAVGHHPYCSPAYPGDAQTWSAWYQMYGTTPSLRSVMEANGDGAKQIWATEFGAPTNGPSGNPGIVSQAVQAAMITKAYQLFAGYSWAGPLFFYQGRDAGTDTGNVEDFYGFLNNDFTPKPSYAAYQAAAAAL